MQNLVFVDVEATGPCPGLGEMTEFGAIHYKSKNYFHGRLFDSQPSADNPALSEITGVASDPWQVFTDFSNWLSAHVKGRPTLVSDNPAFDWQWINYGFWHYVGHNPFGHSARRIGDFYAGITRNVGNTQEWKKFRKTPHDHNPVNDAMGNVEAFEQILKLMKSDTGR